MRRRQPVSGPIGPASLAGLQAWFDAPSLALADGTAVSSFTDTSGNARHATQATGSKQPINKTAQQNGLAVVRFDGTDDYLDTTTFARSQPQTTFAVWKAVSLPANMTVYDSVSAANTGRLYRQAAASVNLRAYAGGTPIETAITPFNGAFAIVATLWNGASSKMWVNGGAGITGSPGAPQGTGIRLGAFGGGTPGGFANMDLGELFAYNSALSLANIDTLGAYLGTRWGITWTTAS